MLHLIYIVVITLAVSSFFMKLHGHKPVVSSSSKRLGRFSSYCVLGVIFILGFTPRVLRLVAIKSEVQDSIVYPAPTPKPILSEASSSASPSAAPASVAKVIEPDKPTKVLAAVTQKQNESSKIKVDNPKSSKNILNALNSYREKMGVSKLSLNPALAEYAKFRVSHFSSIGSIDNHEGFRNFINSEDGFNKLGFMSLGENSGNGSFKDDADLIERFYGSHGPHNENQLDPKWTHVGIAVLGNFTDFIFGANPI
ncbi:hypothetical protein A2858_01525 [Candidatus Daviesbacteria bacterium RIFCSPHIGHO2_01_FULL_36_37]|uniref:SCP domain-containing protein n=3 Tax=Candidatus Daviesiibacteriota TaxID=1752718 RepID=A0A0G0EUG6_9BACT|nr:MAG: hypothetical protein US19_C0015G0015 [Candidatus Daviesbacteria bacterium GW2011_GWB1_36_5]OGE17063.1 MAG: hypothetical protein A2858_01525 [Candidatus Daviesbacteria bacterium RIFCSPHIGHO2_01_FULL_36_37]OGE32696.1 MAG: hypothetical protein A3C99_03230 [Candidatus Daviesbacteria bacterium RIFCSPHIGHO2_02_FULL_37_9]OGE36107.1 MAG: hypothetical protein A3E66_02605 [Candidatus Daviesbacteria bacterium RIFCSPHIGHO2_12_FULL_37_16]